MTPSVVSALTRHLPLKLLALFLGLVVYAHVYTEQERVSVLRAPLRVVGLSPNLVLSEPAPQAVELSARGKGKQVLKLRMQDPEILVDLSGVHPGKVQRMLSPTDVALPPETGVSVTEILEPRMVEFSVDTLVDRTLDVRVTQVGTPPRGFELDGPIRVTPASVRVRGPLSVLETLTQVVTRPLDLENAGDEATLGIVPPESPVPLVTTPATVTVHLPWIQVVTRTVPGVPIELRGLGRNHVARLEPDTAQVAVSGPAALLGDLRPGSVEVWLDLAGLSPGRHLLSPEVLLPTPEKIRLLSVRPARFLVEIGEPPH